MRPMDADAQAFDFFDRLRNFLEGSGRAARTDEAMEVDDVR